MGPYQPKKIEPKWQKIWETTKLYQAKKDDKRPKYYELEFFPYPSAATLHVGHVRNYTLSDSFARYKRMSGFNVLHPMGWDAFGLPAENYAIKSGISPRRSTEANIKVFKRQFSQMGFSYDWSREINSSNPDYYRWTQWLFLLFYKRGLAYRKKALVNWCPQDKTVLANEQVINRNGRNVCERCESTVEQKELEQWFLKITDYAERLLKDLDKIDWPEGIKAMQRNWIGKSQGALIKFLVPNSKFPIEVFTTRPDTLFGATYLVLAPEHPLVDRFTTKAQKAKMEKYVEQARRKTELDRLVADKLKTGVFTGTYALNPATKQKIPIWIADYALMNYGTGAIMAVPGHDQRDYEFALKFNLPITIVIEPVTGEPQTDPEFRRSIVAVVEDLKTGKILSINWGPKLGGNLLIGGGLEPGEDPITTAKREITEETGYQDLEFIGQTETVHHHYFAASKNVPRQIEAIGLHFRLKSQKQMVQKLESDEAGKFTIEWLDKDEVERSITDALHAYVFSKLIGAKVWAGEGKMINSGQFNGLSSSLARAKIVKKFGKAQVNYHLRDWSVGRQRYWGCPIPIIYCTKCGTQPVPEAGLPVILPENVTFEPTGQSPLVNLPSFVNTKCPNCQGPAKRETDTFDAFVDSAWYFLRFADPHNGKAAFDKTAVDYWLPVDTYIGGAEHAVAHLLYARFWTKVLQDAGLVTISEPFKSLRNQGMIGGADGRKMGKRYGNVVTPDQLVQEGYGADALRLYELFIAPLDQAVPWNPSGIVGTRRFLDRVWNLAKEFMSQANHASAPASQTAGANRLAVVINQAVRRMTKELESQSFNTAVSGLMELVNSLYKLRAELPFNQNPAIWQETLSTTVQLLAPFAPHIAEELWQRFGNATSVHLSDWPAWDDNLAQETLVTIILQVNGKMRATLIVPKGTTESELTKLAKEPANIKSRLKGHAIAKTIVLKDRLVNFVIK